MQGLFTAHVTGNFVTLGASIALGTSGAVAKVLALPVFCAVVIATRLLGSLFSSRRGVALDTLLATKVLLLIVGAALAIRFGPFHDGDSWPALLTGMALVAAMAVQNAVHRIHLGSVPPSTLMTGTTTQIMIDLADLIYADPATQTRSDSKLGLMSLNVLVFALGCGAAALLSLIFRRVVLPLAAVAWSAGARSSPDWPERGGRRAIEGLEGSKVRAPRWRDDGRDAIPL